MWTHATHIQGLDSSEGLVTYLDKKGSRGAGLGDLDLLPREQRLNGRGWTRRDLRGGVGAGGDVVHQELRAHSRSVTRVSEFNMHLI